jgi:hypothetical protein
MTVVLGVDMSGTGIKATPVDVEPGTLAAPNLDPPLIDTNASSPFARHLGGRPAALIPGAEFHRFGNHPHTDTTRRVAGRQPDPTGTT